MKILIIALLFISNINIALGDTPNEKDKDLYNEVLQKHLETGHLSDKEIQKQKFYHSNEKSWQKEFNKQVRGVASTIKSPREVIQLKNPAIEISVK